MQAACGGSSDGAAVSPPAAGSQEPAGSRLELGRDTYERVCADCHDTGADGAPVTGEPGDWTGRSALWQAVLFQHAERGYLAMPAQADGDDRPDTRAVDAAAEYMLTQSHPGTPPD
jgi:cytochrome c5